MTQTMFIAECGKRLINPALALENERVVECLKAGCYQSIIEALEEEF